MGLIDSLEKVPEVVKGEFPQELFEPRYRFLFGGAIIQPINFTQGGPYTGKREGKKEGAEVEYIALPAMANVPFYNRKVFVPILYANTILGTMKNRITENLFVIYRSSKKEVLDNIYNPEIMKEKYGDAYKEGLSILNERAKKVLTLESIAAVNATLFRMKPPFLSVSYATGKFVPVLKGVVKAVWHNPLFKAWGIGIGPWGPSRSIVSSIALPLLSDFPLLTKFAEDIAKDIRNELPEVSDEIALFEIPLKDIQRAVEEGKPVTEEDITTKLRFDVGERDPFEVDTAGMYPVIKLRNELASDFYKLGVDFDKEKYKIPIKKKSKKGKKNKNENGENKDEDFEFYDITSPTPVKLAYGGPLTLVSVFSRGSRVTLHTPIEVASFAYAISDIPKFGPNDNVMRIYVLMEFEDITTGERLKLVTATGVGREYMNEPVKELRKKFIEWVLATNYDELIVPTSIGLMTVHLSEITSGGSK